MQQHPLFQGWGFPTGHLAGGGELPTKAGVPGPCQDPGEPKVVPSMVQLIIYCLALMALVF